MREFVVKYSFQGTYEEQISADSQLEAEDQAYWKLDDLLPYDECLHILINDEPDESEEVTLDEQII